MLVARVAHVALAGMQMQPRSRNSYSPPDYICERGKLRIIQPRSRQLTSLHRPAAGVCVLVYFGYSGDEAETRRGLRAPADQRMCIWLKLEQRLRLRCECARLKLTGEQDFVALAVN